MKDFEEKDTPNQPYEDFKDLFPNKNLEEQQLEEQRKFRKKMLPRHIAAFVVYFMIMFLVSSVIAVLISFIPGTLVETPPEEQVVINVVVDIDAMAFITPESYNQYQDKYGNYINATKYNDDYLVIVSASNYIIFKEKFLMEDEEKNLIINQEAFNSFFSGELNQWSENRSIKLLITGESFGARPDFITDYSNLNIVIYDKTKSSLSDGVKNVFEFLIYSLLAGILIYLLLPNIKKDLEPFKQKDRSLIVGIFTGYAFIFGANLVASILRELIGLIFKIPGGVAVNQISVELAIKSPGAPLMILTTVVIGPIVEELIFRKTIFELSRNKWVGIAVSSLLFGLIHVSTELSDITNFGHFLYVFLPYLLMGVGFGFAYNTYKQNVLTVTGTHMLHNLISVIIILAL